MTGISYRISRNVPRRVPSYAKSTVVALCLTYGFSQGVPPIHRPGKLSARLRVVPLVRIAKGYSRLAQCPLIALEKAVRCGLRSLLSPSLFLGSRTHEPIQTVVLLAPLYTLFFDRVAR